MIAKLTVNSKASSFNDTTPNNNPLRRFFDWSREIRAVQVENPQSYNGELAVGASVTVFDGVRTTTLDGTTAFTSTLSALDSGSRYRFTFVAGTNPTFRTDRALTLNTQVMTFTVNANQTVNVSIGAGSMAAVLVGDIIFVPHTTTGDTANVLSTDNAGYWQVLAIVSATNIQIGRLAGESFTASGETQTLTSDSQFQAFSAAGVQVGDSVAISAGFAVATQRTFTIDRVTSTWFEVLSTSPIPAEASKLPTAAGMIFYTNVKRFLRVETDQDAAIQYNGDTGFSNRISPFQPGDVEQPGWDEKCGPAYKLVIVNKSATSLNYSVFTAE